MRIGLPYLSLPQALKEFAFDEKKTIDTNLLSGLLSAIRSMGETVLSSQDGGLKLIDHGDVAIMLETTKDIFYTLIVSRESYILREKLRGFVYELTKLNLFKNFDHSVVLLQEDTKNQIEQIVQEFFE